MLVSTVNITQIRTGIRHPFFIPIAFLILGARMRVVTICMPESYVEGVDKLIKQGMYPNRSEVIRIAIRDLLVEELWGGHSHTGSAPLVTLLDNLVPLIERDYAGTQR